VPEKEKEYLIGGATTGFGVGAGIGALLYWWFTKPVVVTISSTNTYKFPVGSKWIRGYFLYVGRKHVAEPILIEGYGDDGHKYSFEITDVGYLLLDMTEGKVEDYYWWANMYWNGGRL